MGLEIDELNVGGNPVGNPSYAFETIQNNAVPTPLAVADTYYPITGARTQPFLNDFVVDGTALKYTGTATKKFSVSASFSWEADGTLNRVYKVCFMKNGTSNEGEVRAALDNSNVWPRNVGLESVVELATNDTIECQVNDSTDNQGILVIDMLLKVVNIQ
jgi:hypothetical protein